MVLGRKLSRYGSVDTKGIALEMKQLNKFFIERRMFIKFHMIYKKYGDKENFRNDTKNDSSYPAAPFTVYSLFPIIDK